MKTIVHAWLKPEIQEAISKIAKEENRTTENMMETVLIDFLKSYNGN